MYSQAHDANSETPLKPCSCTFSNNVYDLSNSKYACKILIINIEDTLPNYSQPPTPPSQGC